MNMIKYNCETKQGLKLKNVSQESEDKMEVISLVQEKQILEQRLSSLVYGSIEIRDVDGKKYIYVHYREDGIALTKYVDEYSDELYNLILKNNIEAKELKQKIKEVAKKLKELNYVDSELSEVIERNIDFAKKHLVESIYKQAVLEGIATTFVDTQNIIEGGKVNNMTPEDVLKVINLKHAWEFILNKNVITSKTDFNLLCEINKIVEQGFYYNAGKLRNVPVKIGGTNWTPGFPIESVVKEELEEILTSNLSDKDKAIELLLYIMKKQIFIDGNKRTAVIFANHYLISHGLGIIVIPAEVVEEFKVLLISYYEGKDEKNIKKFLKEKCVSEI